MKIIRLTAENVLKLKAVEISPDGNMVVISGKNAAGKSSVLNAIWLALGGGEASRAIKLPLREGEAEGSVELEFEEFTVRREWSGDSTHTRLIVENKAGARYPSPQAMLDGLIGKLSFDPVAFATMSDREQVETLRDLTGLDFTRMDEAYQSAYSERTIVNREIRDLEGTLKGVDFAQLAEADYIDTKTIQERMGEARDADKAFSEAAQEVEACVARREQADNSIQALKDQIETINEELKELARDRQQAVEDTETAQQHLDTLEQPDMDALYAELDEATEHNNKLAAMRTQKVKAERLQECQQKAAELTEELENIKEEKAQAIVGADMPIEGLSFEGEQVLFNEIPFKQASQAEQLKVSLAMAMALNPEIRVIRIQDASLLDKESMKVIEQMTADKDFQVWAEVVADEPGLGVYIEDGSVVDG